MLMSCQFPVKFRTQGFFFLLVYLHEIQSTLAPFLEEEVTVDGSFSKSDKQQIGAHTAEANTQTRACTHREKVSLAHHRAVMGVNSTQINTNCSQGNTNPAAQGCLSFQWIRTKGHLWMHRSCRHKLSKFNSQ